MRKGIMLAYPFEEKRLLTWQPPWIVQPKLDGERCRALWNPLEESWELLSSEENLITSVPHIVENLNHSDIPKDVELDGELYIHGTPFEEIHSIVGRTKSLSLDYLNMEYHVFDIIRLDKPQMERTVLLRRLPLPNSIYRIPFELAHTPDQVQKIFDGFVESGYEGIIVRHVENYYKRARSTLMMKFKPKKEDIYQIIGFEQMVGIDGNLKPMLGSLICCGIDHESKFWVGSGMTDEFRLSHWPKENAQTLVGKMLRVKYQHTTKNGVPRFPVFVEIIDQEPSIPMVKF
jgi:ATP-dependent DNA ligase